MQQAPVDAVAACSKVECHPARRLHGHIPHWAPLCGSSVTTTALVTMARHAMDVSNADASFRTQYVSRHSRGYAPHPQHSLQAWLAALPPLHYRAQPSGSAHAFTSLISAMDMLPPTSRMAQAQRKSR